MRTTINLPDALAERAKARAREEGRTFTSLVEAGLQAVLDRPIEIEHALEPLPTLPGGELLVDLYDRDAVWAALDADGIR